MNVIEQFTIGKSTTAASEDAVVVTSSYAAVIDGATPKTDYRYPSGETPGQLAARQLSQAVSVLPDGLSASEAVTRLSACLRHPEVAPADRPIASIAIYAAAKREVWLVGDCQFAYGREGNFQLVTNAKQIDRTLSEWRSQIVESYLSRGLMSEREIQDKDPGRRIIQPHITRQVRYQNIATPHRFAYGMLDGETVPTQYVKVFSLPPGADTLILATDGYPCLAPTLQQSEEELHRLLAADPLCIGPLSGTKCLKPGNRSYDDRTYLRLSIGNDPSTLSSTPL